MKLNHLTRICTWFTAVGACGSALGQQPPGWQFDPLEVPGARNHDLVLHARIRDYRRDWCDRWLYGPPADRCLIELYNKSLNILPMAELPLYRYAWERWRGEVEGGYFD